MGEPTSVTPQTFEEALRYAEQHGGKYGNYGIDLSSPKAFSETIQREVQRRRGLIAKNGGFEPLEADTADIAIRDMQTGRLRRARQGSTSSALGAFSVSSALGADSLLGG